MDTKKPSSNTIDALLGEPELSSLVELQKFLSEELASSGKAPDFSRSFRPLTDGLGLESPDPAKKVVPPAPTRPFSERGGRESKLDGIFTTDPIPAPDPMVKAFEALDTTPVP